jgi:hypothetical protein
VAQCDPPRGLDQGEPHLLVRLDRQPLPQQRENPARMVVERGERQGSAEPYPRVLVGHQVEEHIGAGGDGGRRHRVVGRALDLVLVDLVLVVLVQIDAADAGEQLDDAAPVRDPRIDDQFEKERNAGQCAGVHVALVVNRPVHPVQRLFALGRIGRRQPPQHRGHITGRSVGMFHRGPVDLVDPSEHPIASPRISTKQCLRGVCTTGRTVRPPHAVFSWRA